MSDCLEDSCYVQRWFLIRKKIAILHGNQPLKLSPDIWVCHHIKKLLFALWPNQ